MHDDKPKDTRRSPSKRGYDSRWRKVRLMVLRANPICQHCNEYAATEVDHIVPLSKGGSRLAMDNLQALCKSCHSKKTRAENKAGSH